MTRSLRDSKLETRTARLKLAPRPEPYWRVMETGRAVGYRRLDKGKPGRWIARLATEDGNKSRYKFESLADADDYADADAIRVLTFGQAQQAARDWFQSFAQTGGNPGRAATVQDAINSYLRDYESRSGRAIDKIRIVVNVHIIPVFGKRPLAELTTAEITEWRNGLVQQEPLRRKAINGKPARADNNKASAKLAAKRGGPDAKERLRKRQASVNRVLTVLKSILNHAFRTGIVDSDLAWRRVTPFKNADQAHVRFLDDEAARKLVEACEPDFRLIVVAALLTGADYGELRTARVRDLDVVVGTLTVSKKRGTHTLALTQQAAKHFAACATGKSRDDLLLRRSDGGAWNDSHQIRRMAAACEKAGISPAINFHILRHTFATRALRKGTPMHYVSHQLGHKNIRTTQKHYAHIIPSDSANAIRQGMNDLSFEARES